MDEVAQTLEQSRKAIELNKQGIAKLESQLKRHHQTRSAIARQAVPATTAASSNTISPPMMAALAEQQAILLKRVEELRPKQTRQPVARSSAPKANPSATQGTETTPKTTQGANRGAGANPSAGEAGDNPSPSSSVGDEAGETDPVSGEVAGRGEEEPAAQLRRAINGAKQALKKSDAALARLKVPPAAVDVLIREGHIPSDKLQFARQKMAQIERDANKLTSSRTAPPKTSSPKTSSKNASGIDEGISPENATGNTTGIATGNTTGMAKGISLGSENKNNLGGVSPENATEAYSARTPNSPASSSPTSSSPTSSSPSSSVSRPKPRKRHISV